MLDRYLKYKEFSDWILHNRFMTKLIGKPIFYTLILEDNRRYEILFFGGELFSYKYFIFSLTYFYSSRFYYSFKSKNKIKLDEYNRIIECLIENKIVNEQKIMHTYHKNAKPTIVLEQGSYYLDFMKLMQDIDFSNEYELLSVIENEKNE